MFSEYVVYRSQLPVMNIISSTLDGIIASVRQRSTVKMKVPSVVMMLLMMTNRNGASGLAFPHHALLRPPASLGTHQQHRAGGGAPNTCTVTRISDAPDVFHLRNLLSISECQELISQVQATVMETATTRLTSNARTLCQVAWVSDTPLLQRLISTTANLLLHPQLVDECEIEIEDLQVLRYDPGGAYALHHDGEPRVLTVIYYCEF
jgi:hypothetical protein